jgi:hypothetical protein
MLAPLLRRQDYATFFAQTQGYKILDNGVAEGERITMPDLASFAKEFNVDEVVVPDVMGSASATIKLARAFERFAEPSRGYMGVVQGATVADVVKCATALSFLDYITVLGVPRHLTKIHRDLRVNFGEALHNMYDRDLPLHFLGSGSDPREVVRLSTLDTARSHDTSMPIVAAYQKSRLATFTYKARQDNYFDLRAPDRVTTELMYDNIHTYLDWAGAEPIC